MNIVFKIALIVLISLVFFFLSTWSFNHINPWLSILFTFIGVTYGIYFTYKKIKTKINNEKN
jgi:arginine exporter protein ArgO